MVLRVEELEPGLYAHTAENLYLRFGYKGAIDVVVDDGLDPD